MRKIIAAALLTALSTAAFADVCSDMEEGRGTGLVEIAHYGGKLGQSTVDVTLGDKVVNNCWGKKARVGMIQTSGRDTPRHLRALDGCWHLDGDKVVMVVQHPISMETVTHTFPRDQFTTVPPFQGWDEFESGIFSFME